MRPRHTSPATDPPCLADSPSSAHSPLLAVRGLCVTYRSRLGRISPALADINFDLHPGEVLGVLGESGSGKSTLASALLRLLPPNGQIERGAILLDGENLLELSPRQLEAIRGARLSAIFQEPSLALHPALRVGRQIGDVLAAHGYAGRSARRDKVNALLSAVFRGDTQRSAEQFAAALARGTRRTASPDGYAAALGADLAWGAGADRRDAAATGAPAQAGEGGRNDGVASEDAERIAEAYPHQLSGGQRQRVLVAQAIACNPALVIADEPTASLGATTQWEIMALFREMKQRRNLAMIFITHNPALLEDFADRILVLYAGRIAEIGPAKNILESPLHPYTQALLRCLPPPLEIAGVRTKEKLPVIPGELPRAAGISNGCAFEPRCAERMELCTRRRPAAASVREQAVACFRYEGAWN